MYWMRFRTSFGRLPRPGRQLAVLEGHLAGPIRVQTDDAAGERRLARAGLSHERRAGLGGDVEVDVEKDGRRAVGGGDLVDREDRSGANGRCDGHDGRLAMRLVLKLECSQATYEPTSHADRRGRRIMAAGVEDQGAAGGERAAGRPPARTRRLPLDAREHLGPVGGRDRGEQSAGVGMNRKGEDRFGASQLDDPAGIHDGHVGDKAADDGEVVAHVDRRHSVGAAQATNGVEHVALRGDVKAGRRLIEDDERRPAGEGHRQRHPLLLAA